MKLSSKNSRRIRISALWLVFLVLTNSLLFHFLKTRQYNDTKSALLDQAGIVTGQIPVLVENEISTRIGRDINQEKLNTLAYVLGQKGDMEQSGPFIDGYAEAAEMNGITVYGRDGKVFYHTPGTEIPAVDEQLVRMMLEARTTFLENDSGETEVSLYGAYNKFVC